jgi:hypothetical protein
MIPYEDRREPRARAHYRDTRAGAFHPSNADAIYDIIDKRCPGVLGK